MAEELPEGTVTVLFTDIVGSTELTNRLGDEPARAVLREVDSVVRSRLAHHRGIEVKGLGDGHMVAFTSARRAVLCAVDIQKSLPHPGGDAAPTLGMRIGLHTGEVIREEGDLFGATVNFAARVAAQGGARDVLLSSTTRSLLGAVTDIAFEDRGEVELKGFPGKWPIFSVAWQPDAGDHGGIPGQIPYVGRENEQALLREALARAMDGAGSVVLLSGEAGIGKTRLASELMAEARGAGCFTVIGHCYDMDVTAPFLPFMEALDYAGRVVPPERLRAALGSVAAEVARIAPRLRQIFPDLGPPADLPPEQARHYLFTCIGDYLQNATATQPTVLVLDDLHWADDSTSLLLEHVAGRCAEMSLLVIGTYRDSDLAPAHPFARAIDRLTRSPNVRRVSLRRFPREGVRVLLRALSERDPPPSLVSLVAEETEGVPLFVQELYRYLDEEGRLFDESGAWRTDITIGEVEVPEGVRLLITRRLERVSEDARRVLTLASVIGRGFTFDLLAKLDNRDVDAMLDALDEAEAAHLLVASSGREARYTFSHEQVRQTLLGMLTVPRRHRLHLQIAEALEAGTPEEIEENAPELAYHLYHAGSSADAAKTVRYLEIAGDRARRAGAFAEAELHYRRALELIKDDATRSAVLFRLALVVRATSGSEAAVGVFQEATAVARAAGLVDQLWRSQIETARSLLQMNRFHESYETALEALAADTLPPRARGIVLVIMSAVGAHAGRDPEEEEARFREGLGLLGDPMASLSFGLTYASEWYDTGRARELLPLLDEFRRAAPPSYLHEGLRYAAHSQIMMGNLAEGLTLAQEAASVAARHGDTFGESIARTFVADVSLARFGDLQAFVASADDRRKWLNQSLPAWSFAKWHPLWLSGDWEEAAAELEDEWRRGLPLGRRFALAALARILTHAPDLRPDLGAVLDELQRSPLQEPGTPVHYTTGTWLMHAIEAFATVRRDWDWWRAAQLASQVIARGAMLDTAVGDLGLWQKSAGISYACAGRWEDAFAHFEIAMEQASRLPHLIEQAEARRWYAWSLIERGQPGDAERARPLLEDAAHQYRTLGMRRHLEIADRLRRRCQTATSARD